MEWLDAAKKDPKSVRYWGEKVEAEPTPEENEQPTPGYHGQVEPVPTPNDPWANRAGEMKCRTCMWFVVKGGGILGRCRKSAPTMTGYPATYETDWCGQHKLDENKI